mmetsp:Transcript_9808/g.25472  ORF Transcript_9808/g.25472 Transcript_9808/m.25472 type:complete len:429 (+) Transcript_9808:430-1716(+)
MAEARLLRLEHVHRQQPHAAPGVGALGVPQEDRGKLVQLADPPDGLARLLHGGSAHVVSHRRHPVALHEPRYGHPAADLDPHDAPPRPLKVPVVYRVALDDLVGALPDRALRPLPQGLGHAREELPRGRLNPAHTPRRRPRPQVDQPRLGLHAGDPAHAEALASARVPLVPEGVAHRHRLQIRLARGEPQQDLAPPRRRLPPNVQHVHHLLAEAPQEQPRPLVPAEPQQAQGHGPHLGGGRRGGEEGEGLPLKLLQVHVVVNVRQALEVLAHVLRQFHERAVAGDRLGGMADAPVIDAHVDHAEGTRSEEAGADFAIREIGADRRLGRGLGDGAGLLVHLDEVNCVEKGRVEAPLVLLGVVGPGRRMQGADGGEERVEDLFGLVPLLLLLLGLLGRVGPVLVFLSTTLPSAPFLVAHCGGLRDAVKLQ